MEEGLEYLYSLKNYIARNDSESGIVDDIFEKKRNIAIKTGRIMDESYSPARKEILDALLSGSSPGGVIVFDPCLVSSSNERYKEVERLVNSARKLFRALLVEIDDYGTGKRNDPPEFEVTCEEGNIILSADEKLEIKKIEKEDFFEQPYFQ